MSVVKKTSHIPACTKGTFTFRGHGTTPLFSHRSEPSTCLCCLEQICSRVPADAQFLTNLMGAEEVKLLMGSLLTRQTVGTQPQCLLVPWRPSWRPCGDAWT